MERLRLGQIVTYTVPGGIFRFSDYPNLKAVMVCIKGGRGGDGPNGEPGHEGETCYKTFYAKDYAFLNLKLESGKPGYGGGKRGEDAFALLELYY